MPSPVLADSNILLRVAQPSHLHHAVALAAIDKLLAQNFDLCIVTQNLVEFWAVATRPLPWMKCVSCAVFFIYWMDRWVLLTCGQNWVTGQLVSGKQAHDAHLAAAMGVYGVQQLLTFNGNDFKRYPGITVLNPELL